MLIMQNCLSHCHFFFIVLLLAHSVIDRFAHSLLCPPDYSAGHEQKLFLRPYRRPGDNIIHSNL